LLRQQLQVWDANRRQNVFYKILFEYDYKGAGTDKHESPTKRLIQQKNTITSHKRRMSAGNNLLDSTHQPYTISYHTGTKNSYIVEPKNGSANYDMVE
jgi:hypothetical protein